MKDPIEIVNMFDDIAPVYDKINRRLSFRTDVGWRRKLRKAVAGLPHENIIDISSGTGDLAIELSKLHPKTLLAADPSAKMLEVAARKFDKLHIDATTLICYAEALPFENGSFDLATCSFGIRNFASLEKGLTEMHRILCAGGHVAILEFGLPQGFFWRNLYRFYFNRILPLRGKRMSQHAHAYTYLNQTVNQFPYGKAMETILTAAGFSMVKTKKLSGGIAWMYVAEKRCRSIKS